MITETHDMSEMNSESPADRAYRRSVRPLGIVFAGGGLLFAGIGLFRLTRIGWVPFVETDWGKRLAVLIIGVIIAVIGVGLLMKSRAAWFALFVYLILGAIWVVIGVNYDPEMTEGIALHVTLFGLLVNAVLVVGLYLVTRPVFGPRSSRRGDT